MFLCMSRIDETAFDCFLTKEFEFEFEFEYVGQSYQIWCDSAKPFWRATTQRKNQDGGRAADRK